MAGTANTHILSVLVQNKPGVLARIAGLISRRGYNIESLAVGPTESPEMSRITLQVNVEDVVLEQITKQLNKLIEVLKIVGGNPQVAPECELQASGYGESLDGGDHRLAQQHPCAPKWPVAVFVGYDGAYNGSSNTQAFTAGLRLSW